mgnify:CR=1 FL=1
MAITSFYPNLVIRNKWSPGHFPVNEFCDQYEWFFEERKLIPNGYRFDDSNIELYEANIPPLLRFFHIREVSPSGWISVPHKKSIPIKGFNKSTTCDYEFITNSMLHVLLMAGFLIIYF